MDSDTRANVRVEEGTNSPASRLRLPPALLVDVPVGALLIACWLVVGVAWAHIIVGLALIGLIVVHLKTRRLALTRLVRPLRKGRARAIAHRLGYSLFLILTVAMVASGLLRWFGVPADYAMHAIASYTLLAFVAMHVVVIRRSLRSRLGGTPKG